MKKTLNVAWAIVVCAATIILGSCKKDDDQPEIPQPVINEPEQITTVELHFTESATSAHFQASWADLDGPGGDAPIIDSITLDSGAVYEVEVMFLDASGDSAEDLTEEIHEEGDQHIICFEPEGALSTALNVVRTDSDGNYEVGLESTWSALSKSTGELHLTLKHQPDGLKDGTCSPGETDVEVHFDLIIK